MSIVSKAILKGAGATLLLLLVYALTLTLVSGWIYALDQFAEFWPYVVSLAVGFGIQIALYIYLKNLLHHSGASGKVVAVSGTTSTAAMVSCCTHYLVNIVPVLGATGLMTFVSQYQVGLFWFGIAANAIGITYIGRKIILMRKMHA
jgi:Cu+-exporting ATPase